jgi:hypothetical protein
MVAVALAPSLTAPRGTNAVGKALAFKFSPGSAMIFVCYVVRINPAGPLPASVRAGVGFQGG